jgi:hypothetical protein
MLKAAVYLTMEDSKALEAIDNLLWGMDLSSGPLNSCLLPLTNLAHGKASVDDMVHLKNEFPLLAERVAEENPDSARIIREASSQVSRVLGTGNISMDKKTINILEKFGMNKTGAPSQ